MILKIEFENFFSIRDRIRIDFRAANINTKLARELRHNVIDWNGVPVLKSLGLFGPNASGKSNILKAINFCCRMILDSHLNNERCRIQFLSHSNLMAGKKNKLFSDRFCLRQC